MFDGFPVSEEERQRNTAKLQQMVRKRLQPEDIDIPIVQRKIRLKGPTTPQEENNGHSQLLALQISEDNYQALVILSKTIGASINETVKTLILSYIKSNNGEEEL